jgi:F-type H+-transporting ATPase subunit a
MFQLQSEVINLRSDILFELFGLPITDTMASTLLTFVFVIFFVFLASRISLHRPTKFQLLVESTLEGLIDFLSQLSDSKQKIIKILPVVLSLVGFIFLSNMLLLIFPFFGAITFDGKALFRSSTSDINMTLAMALAMVVLSQIYFIRNSGILNYLLKFLPFDKVVANFKKGIIGGLMSLIDIFISLLDIIGEIAKVASLSLRLLGNMFAGELLLRIFMGLFAIIVPVPIILLGGLSGVIQSIVFGALVTSYLLSSLQKEED